MGCDRCASGIVIWLERKVMHRGNLCVIRAGVIKVSACIGLLAKDALFATMKFLAAAIDSSKMSNMLSARVSGITLN